MYENKRSKARFLTASSLAMASILIMGAGSAYAASTGNATPNDQGEVTGTVTGDVAVNYGPAVEALTLLDGFDLLGDASGGALFTNDGSSVVIKKLTVAGDSVLGGDTGVDSKKYRGSLPEIVMSGTGLTLEVFSGYFNIDKLSLGGNSLTLDPDFGALQVRYDPNNVGALAVKELSGTTSSKFDGGIVDGKITVGQNSHLTVGQADQGAFAANVIQNIEANSNHRWKAPSATPWDQSMTAALALTKSINIDVTTPVGGIKVDGAYKNDGSGSAAATAGTVEFSDNSLLIVDNAGIGNQAAIKGNGAATALTVGNNATLYIANANVKTGQSTTTILGGFGNSTAAIGSTGTTSSWNGDYLLYDTRLINGTLNTPAADGTVSVTNEYTRSAVAYADGKLTNGMAQAVDGVFLGGYNNFNSEDAGARFISRAVSSLYLDTNKANDKKVVTTMEGAAAMASLAGVQTGSYSVSNTVAGNYNARLSYLRDTAPAAGSEPGSVAVWVNPFYSFSDVDGVDIGRHSAEYEISYGGATIGADTNINENFRLGLAVSIGGGDTESKGGTFNKTDSDFDFWGIGVYGSYTNGQFGLTGDIGYTGTSYDIEQRSSGIANKLTADVDTNAFTVGLNGEYRFMTESCLNIIPHVGIRYTNLKTDSYRVKEKGAGTAFRVSSDKQNIWTFPVGVTFTGDVDTNSGWVIKPTADIGAIFAAGDLDADSKYRVGDTRVSGKVTADDVVDAVTFNGLVGLKADAGNGFSVGLDYNLKASSNLTSHGVTGMIRYEF